MSLVPCFDRDREPLVTVGYGAGHWDSPDRIEINVTRCLTAEALGRGSGALYTQCGVTHDFLGICGLIVSELSDIHDTSNHSAKSRLCS